MGYFEDNSYYLCQAATMLLLSKIKNVYGLPKVSYIDSDLPAGSIYIDIRLWCWKT